MTTCGTWRVHRVLNGSLRLLRRYIIYTASSWTAIRVPSCSCLQPECIDGITRLGAHLPWGEVCFSLDLQNPLWLVSNWPSQLNICCSLNSSYEYIKHGVKCCLCLHWYCNIQLLAYMHAWREIFIYALRKIFCRFICPSIFLARLGGKMFLGVV